MKFLQYLKDIKKIGFRNYYYYLKLKEVSKFFGIELPNYNETIRRLNILSKIINDSAPTAEEFANGMINSFRAMKATITE